MVLVGGGSRGDWPVGFAKRLMDQHCKPYHYVAGISTGSLMSCFRSKST